MNSLPTLPAKYQKHMEQMFAHILPVTVRGVTTILESTQNGEIIIHVRQTGLTIEARQTIGEVTHESLKL